jgi:hypothetical protein
MLIIEKILIFSIIIFCVLGLIISLYTIKVALEIDNSKKITFKK